MMFFFPRQIPSWFFGALLPDPPERERERERERGLVMTIMELAAIPLWTLGIAAAITGALALFLCAFADENINALLDDSLNLAYHGARAEKPGSHLGRTRLSCLMAAGDLIHIPEMCER